MASVSVRETSWASHCCCTAFQTSPSRCLAALLRLRTFLRRGSGPYLYLAKLEAYEEAVARAKEHVLDGDIYQGVLSRVRELRGEVDRVVVAARTGGGSGWDGVSAFVVDVDDPAVEGRRHRDQLHVPREPRLVEVSSDRQPRLAVDRLRRVELVPDDLEDDVEAGKREDGHHHPRDAAGDLEAVAVPGALVEQRHGQLLNQVVAAGEVGAGADGAAPRNDVLGGRFEREQVARPDAALVHTVGKMGFGGHN